MGGKVLKTLVFSTFNFWPENNFFIKEIKCKKKLNDLYKKNNSSKVATVCYSVQFPRFVTQSGAVF